VDCGLWPVDCGLWTVDYGLWTVSGLQRERERERKSVCICMCVFACGCLFVLRMMSKTKILLTVRHPLSLVISADETQARVYRTDFQLLLGNVCRGWAGPPEIGRCRGTIASLMTFHPRKAQSANFDIFVIIILTLRIPQSQNSKLLSLTQTQTQTQTQTRTQTQTQTQTHIDQSTSNQQPASYTVHFTRRNNLQDRPPQQDTPLPIFFRYGVRVGSSFAKSIL
jgi:hypothetical protein